MLSSLIQVPSPLMSSRASWCGTCFRHTMIFMGEGLQRRRGTGEGGNNEAPRPGGAGAGKARERYWNQSESSTGLRAHERQELIEARDAQERVGALLVA